MRSFLSFALQESRTRRIEEETSENLREEIQKIITFNCFYVNSVPEYGTKGESAII